MPKSSLNHFKLGSLVNPEQTLLCTRAENGLQQTTTITTKCCLKLISLTPSTASTEKPFLRRVQATFPELARWAIWCYAKPTKLVFGTRTIDSDTRVQQKDSLGPPLLSLAVHDTVQGLHNLSINGHKFDMTAFYLDDGVIAGDVRVVAEALRTLEQRCATLGLKAQPRRKRTGLTQRHCGCQFAGLLSSRPANRPQNWQILGVHERLL